MNVDSESDSHWRGVPLTELYGSQSPWGAPEFPLVVPSYNHAVLYHVPNNGCVADDRPPKPQIGQDKWDSEHVRMPCSHQSLYPVKNDVVFDPFVGSSSDIFAASSNVGNFWDRLRRVLTNIWPWGASKFDHAGDLKNTGEMDLKKRWELIETALSKPLRNSHDLAEAILSYNTKFRTIWKFKGLHKLFNEYLEEEESKYFFNVTLPEIAKLALALPTLVQAPIPLLKQKKNRSVSLSQQQVACLLANAFFCTFPRRNSRKGTSEYASYPYINFNTAGLYEYTDSDSNLEKLKCICHYFRRVTIQVPVGTVTYSRRWVAGARLGGGAWATSRRAPAALALHVHSRHTIEDAQGLIQVDFANKFLGGGVLGHGCVQEEIRFVICPELLLSMLFTEELKSNEAVMIIGCERFSKYDGYGDRGLSSFSWAGDFVDSTPRDSSARRRTAVLAIDAAPVHSVLREFTRDSITRELNKAWVGVSFDSGTPGGRLCGVATGNWGCGAFGGTPHLKSLLQLMACAEVGRPMAYYTFGDDNLRDDIVNMYNLLARYNVTVGQLYNHLLKFSENRDDVMNHRLYAYLERVIKEKDPPVPQPEPVHMETNMTEYTSDKGPGVEKELNDSPDLFSSEGIDEALIDAIVTVENTEKQTETTYNQTNLEENKNTESSTTKQSLFDTMQKMDDEPNSSIESPILGNQNKNVTLNESNTSDKEDKVEPTSDVKRKSNKKMTILDYFARKHI